MVSDSVPACDSFSEPCCRINPEGATEPLYLACQRVMKFTSNLPSAPTSMVKVHFAPDTLDNIKGIFERMKAGHIDGRIVMKIA